MIVLGTPKKTTWGFCLAPDGDRWVMKAVEAGPQLLRGGLPIDTLEEALEQIRLLAELLANDDLTINISVMPRRSDLE